ncbi:MAG TPA: NapC/NirT family cytochrome c [Pyrinomonadaceae bacterium]
MDDIPAAQSRTIGRLLRNWLSWTGFLVSLSAVFAFLFLFAIDIFAARPNPYLGILAYVIAPAFFLLGVALTLLGLLIRWWQQRRAVSAAEPLVLRIDFSSKRGRRLLVAFGVASVIFLFITAFGSYQTYHITESVEFCGKACHVPMEPQFVGQQQTAHARVGCVDCHVGPGAAAYFKTKLNGVKQLYHTFRDDYDRPIRVSASNPRPPQMICEQCHWPQRYVGNVERTYQHYLSDEKNTPFAVRLLMNVGGGDPANGPPGGIHWHMNIHNKIEYIATDDDHQNIPWVRATNPQGEVIEYRAEGFSEDPSKYQLRRMDCMDCHSRPAHKLKAPNDAVDIALSTGRLDPKTPWVKQKVVATLVKPYKTKAEAEQTIAADLRETYPDRAQAEPIIKEAQAIYRTNFFPEVKADWRARPDFVGHKNSNGCFRCHDGKHVAADGQKSIKASDCRSCHLILAQGDPEKMNEVNPQGHEFFHIDSEYSDFSCTDCHTGGVQK